jgi:N-acyl-D-amino-acid deacylase
VEDARRRGVDVTADCYPYAAWQSSLKVLVPDKQWTDAGSVQRALDDVGGGRNIQITRLPMFPQYVGRRLDEAAREAGISEAELYIRLVADEDAGIIGHTMSEDDVRAFYRQPWVMVASDGGIGGSHPRGAGTFPRVLGRMVRDEGVLTLPDAIRKMTSLPASRLGLTDRGVLAAGARADVVLFDPATILDRATFEAPGRLSVGMYGVWVDGQAVWFRERPGGVRPGTVLETRSPRSP